MDEYSVFWSNPAHTLFSQIPHLSYFIIFLPYHFTHHIIFICFIYKTHTPLSATCMCLEVGPSTRTGVASQVAASLKRTDSPSPRSHVVLIPPQLGWTSQDSISSVMEVWLCWSGDVFGENSHRGWEFILGTYYMICSSLNSTTMLHISPYSSRIILLSFFNMRN